MISIEEEECYETIVYGYREKTILSVSEQQHSNDNCQLTRAKSNVNWKKKMKEFSSFILFIELLICFAAIKIVQLCSSFASLMMMMKMMMVSMCFFLVAWLQTNNDRTSWITKTKINTIIAWFQFQNLIISILSTQSSVSAFSYSNIFHLWCDSDEK